MPKKMRRIVVDDAPFLWRREHLHLDGCVEVLTVVAADGERRARPRLTLRFRAHDGWSPGDFDAGVLRRGGEEPVNLNRPAVVAALIREARSRGWTRSVTTVDEENPYAWLGGVPKGI